MLEDWDNELSVEFDILEVKCVCAHRSDDKKGGCNWDHWKDEMKALSPSSKCLLSSCPLHRIGHNYLWIRTERKNNLFQSFSANTNTSTIDKWRNSFREKGHAWN